MVVETPRGDADRERAVLSTSYKELVDGVIYVPQALTPEDYLPLPLTQPTATLGERPAQAAGLSLDYVEIADEQGAHAAVAHLLAQGRRRIAALYEQAEPRAGGRRLRGYRRALEDAGVAYDDSLVVGVDTQNINARRVGYRSDQSCPPKRGSQYIKCYCVNAKSKGNPVMTVSIIDSGIGGEDVAVDWYYL